MNRRQQRRLREGLAIWLGRVTGVCGALLLLVTAGQIYTREYRDTVMLSRRAETATSYRMEVTVTESPSAEKSTSTATIDRPSTEAWNLRLVNSEHRLPDYYTVQTVDLIDGQAVDERCYEDLQNMMDDCRAAGGCPYICSSYRSRKRQTQLFEENVRSLMAQGYTETQARQETARNIAIPGTSEHELGLAVDIVDRGYQVLDEEQADTVTQQWLMKNSWRYGFVLRYPQDKSDITGIVYEPWHYRYVGQEAAGTMQEEQLCLEEYLDKYAN